MMAALLAAVLVVACSVARAATQGSQGSTSTGSITITASVPARAQITNLTDVTFSPTDLTVAASNAQNVCVWSNTATKQYTVTASGSGTASAFTLASGVLTPVPYTVQWNQTSGQTSGTGLTTGTASSAYTSTATTPTCASGPSTTASLIVTISATNLQAMQASASYTGTLTLLITPQ
jgi:hypothetical protein